MAIFAALAIASNSNEANEEKVINESAPAIEVSAKQLAADYSANEVSADQRYKDKVLQVSGTVESINKDITDDIYIVLTGADDEFGMDGVHCSFSKGHTNEAAALSKGQKIIIKGIGAGMIMGSAQLSGCTIPQ